MPWENQYTTANNVWYYPQMQTGGITGGQRMGNYYQQTVVTTQQPITCGYYYGSQNPLDYIEVPHTVFYQSYPYGNGVSYNTPAMPPETEEQRREREQRDRDNAAKEATRRKRAKEALCVALTKEQQEQLENEKHFELRVNNKLYRIRPGSRVELLDERTKKILRYYCIHPELSHDLPCEDVALSQKLLLEADEHMFLRVANETRAA